MTTLPTDRTIRNRRFSESQERAFKPDHYHREKFEGQQLCAEPYITGSNILPDPSFENTIADNGGGPNGDEIPKLDVPAGTLEWYSNGAPVRPAKGGLTAPYFWTGHGAEEYPFVVSTANPDDGASHARAVYDSSGAVTGGVSNLDMTYLVNCIEGTGSAKRVYGWRVNPGDIISMSYRAVASALDNNATTAAHFQFRSADLVQALSLSNVVSITTAYATYQHQVAAPAFSHYVRAWINVGRTNNPAPANSNFDVDDATLSIT